LVRKMRGTAPNLKALGITGYAVEEVAQELREVGFLGVISKPFAIETLARVTRRLLDTS
jgi:CheY-like chemotaxis protein